MAEVQSSASIESLYFDPERGDIVLSVRIPEQVLDALRVEPEPVVSSEEEVERDVDQVLGMLTPREERLLRIKYGYRSDPEKDAELIGNRYWIQRVIAARMGISQPHVSRVSGTALRKLRHPSRSRHLRRHVPDEGSVLPAIHPGAKRIIGAIFGFNVIT